MSSDIVVSSGQTVSGLTISAGETLTVLKGGTATDITVSHGSAIISGGVIDNSLVEAGGTIAVLAGGTASANQIISNGGMVVSAGGSAYATQVLDGYERVRGYDSGSMVTGSGVQTVYAGGVVSSAAVQTGGLEVVNGGVSFTPQIQSGGRLELSAGVTSSAFVFSATQIVTGGTAIATLVDFASLSAIGSDAIVRGTIDDFSQLAIGSGASAFDTEMDGGGQVVAASGGLLSSTINYGGSVIVESGGNAAATSVYASLIVFAGGSATEISLRNDENDPALIVLPGASVSGVTEEKGDRVISAGTTFISGGADAHHGPTDNGEVVDPGMEEYVLAGGTATSTRLDSGGVLVLGQFGHAPDTIVQAGGVIDFIALSFASGGTASVSAEDVLKVTVGGSSAKLQLSGNYAGETFVLSHDPGTGTIVTLEGTAQIASAALVHNRELLGGLRSETVPAQVYAEMAAAGGYEPCDFGRTAEAHGLVLPHIR